MKTIFSLLFIGCAGISLATTTSYDLQTMGEPSTGTGGGTVCTVSLNPTILAATDYTVSFDFSYKANEFANKWGSALLASSNVPTAVDYTGGFQFYLSAGGNLQVKLAGANSETLLKSGISADTGYSLALSFSQARQEVTCTLWDSADKGAPLATLTKSASNVGFDFLSTNAPKSTLISNLKVTTQDAIPEPSTASLGLLGLASLLLRRRRR